MLRHHLAARPIERIDLGRLVTATATESFSGADLAHLCDTAAASALLASSRSGAVRRIGMGDFTAALRQVRPSTGPWFQEARNVALFANESGEYNELLAYLRAHKLA